MAGQTARLPKNEGFPFYTSRDKMYAPARLERFDIVNEYAWTTVPKNSELRAEAPNAYITGYELEKSQFQQFIEGYLNLTKKITTGSTSPDAGVEFYKSLYSGSTKSKASFNFPYFDNNIRSFSNNFDDTFSKVSSRGAEFGGTAGSLLQGAEREIIGVAGAAGQTTGAFRSAAGFLGPGNAQNLLNSVGDFTSAVTGGSQGGATGTYIETPKFYQYENTDAPLSIRFILANTIDEEDADKNLTFIHEFTRINRPRRKGPIEMSFPYIYHIEVPCQRYIEWAFLQDLQIELLGTKRKIRHKNGCTIVPEAYGCTFQFKSLTVEAANFMNPDLLCSDNCAFEEYEDKQRAADIASVAQQKAEYKEIAKEERAKTGMYQSYKGMGMGGETRLPATPGVIESDIDRNQGTGYGENEVDIIPRYGLGNPYWRKQNQEEMRNNPDPETYLKENRGDKDGDGVNDWLQNELKKPSREVETEPPSTGDPITDRYINNEEYIDSGAIIYPEGEGPDTPRDFKDPPVKGDDDLPVMKPGKPYTPKLTGKKTVISRDELNKLNKKNK